MTLHDSIDRLEDESLGFACGERWAHAHRTPDDEERFVDQVAIETFIKLAEAGMEPVAGETVRLGLALMGNPAEAGEKEARRFWHEAAPNAPYLGGELSPLFLLGFIGGANRVFSEGAHAELARLRAELAEIESHLGVADRRN